MIYVPYSVEFVSEMDENHPVIQEMLVRAGQNLPNVLAEMLEELLSDDVFPKINNGSTFARILTLPQALSESLIDDTEKVLREASDN
jgi:uncharacterized protein YbcC (UPF0753/DUF2309 family)